MLHPAQILHIYCKTNSLWLVVVVVVVGWVLPWGENSGISICASSSHIPKELGVLVRLWDWCRCGFAFVCSVTKITSGSG